MFLFKNFTGVDKKCSGCKEWKPVSEFGKEKRAGSGLKPRCKKCSNDYYNLFYPNIRVNKLKQISNKYIRKGQRKSKFSEVEHKSMRLCRKLIHRLAINKNGRRTFEMLGYDYKDLINHLGRWTNKGENIDHKIPITWFADLEDFKVINDLRNLHIITEKENQCKHNRYSHPVSFEYFEMVKDKLKPQYKTKITHYGNTN